MVTENIRTHLSKDPVFAPLVAQLEITPRPDFDGDVYYGLVRSIAYQQLSGKAAGTIFGRFLALFPDEYPEPERLLQFSVEELRSVGLSRSKASYIQNVAFHFQEHGLRQVDWRERSDEDILADLTTIKGVGQWTVEMVLMFILKRPDVLPLDDLVVRGQMVELYELGQLKGKILKQALLEVAEAWRPYRSYASRYLWASKNTDL